MGIFEECQKDASLNRLLKVDLLLADLNEEDRESLLSALREPSIPIRRIVKVLNKRGISVSREAISNWREHNKIGI
jgi:hypothetical protein